MSGILAELIIACEGGDPEQAGHRINAYERNHKLPQAALHNLRVQIGGKPALSGIATYTENIPSPTFPSWAAKAGAIFGGLTLVFFMAVVIATMTGRVIPPSGRFPIIAVLALGLAMATAFLGGDAVAKGRLPLPYLKDPIQFSVAGGIAVFVIVLVIGNALFGSSSSPDGPSQTTGTQGNTERVVPPAPVPVKQCTGEKTLVFTPKDPGVMQLTPDGHRVALGDGGGGTTLEQWKYSWRAPAKVTSVHYGTTKRTRSGREQRW